MTRQNGIFCLFFYFVFLLSAHSALGGPMAGQHTPLIHDQMPCVAENLRETDHYICTDDHEMICLSGWSDPANLCRTPVCQFKTSEGEGEDAVKTCSEHGECVRPNVCACAVGWEGVACDECIAMPGCLDGTCDREFECNCNDETKYHGALCDIPVCKEGCEHGYCVQPGECICEEGWSGELCDECIKLPGCLHGSCKKTPLECSCDEGWMGSLCDCPVCREGCDMDHGFCTNENGFANECICYPGWSGPNCTECIKYPGCPASGTCNEPWECNCPEGVEGKYCNHHVKHNLLPQYYHHQMSVTCQQMNRDLSANGHKNEESSFDFNFFGTGDDEESPFGPELVNGKAENQRTTSGPNTK